MPEFTWLPANQATSADVEAVFATGGAHKCRCQALKVPGWIWRDTTQDERDSALQEQTACGTGGPTSGLIGYVDGEAAGWVRSEEHTSELQSLMRISYAVFCLKKKKRKYTTTNKKT